MSCDLESDPYACMVVPILLSPRVPAMMEPVIPSSWITDVADEV